MKPQGSAIDKILRLFAYAGGHFSPQRAFGAWPSAQPLGCRGERVSSLVQVDVMRRSSWLRILFGFLKDKRYFACVFKGDDP